MFKKKETNEKKANIFEPEVVIPSKKDSKSKKDNRFNKKFKKDKKPKKDIEFIDEFSITKNTDILNPKEDKSVFSSGEYHFIDKDTETECASEQKDEDYKVQIEPIVEVKKAVTEPKSKEKEFAFEKVDEVAKSEDNLTENLEHKKDIDIYFTESKKNNKKLKKDPIKNKKISKRKQKKDLSFLDLRDQKVFRFRNKKYFKVEEFIKYLDDNFLEIDQIAKEVMNDENFYGWVSKKSGIFDDSIKRFKEIKDKIAKI